MAMSRGQRLVSLALQKINKEQDTNNNDTTKTDIEINVVSSCSVEPNVDVTNLSSALEEDKHFNEENIESNKTNPLNGEFEGVSSLYIATPVEIDEAAKGLDLNDDVIDQQLEDFYDLDDSIADPDFIPDKEDVNSSSGSENEEINTHEMSVDHEEVVIDQNLTINENKRRASGERNWVKNQNKRLRMHGKSYKGMKKENGKWGYIVDRKERVLSDRNCSKRCAKSTVKQCSKITEDDRMSIFTMFWDNMTWEERKVYVNSLVATSEVAAKTAGVGETSRRNRSYKYYFRKDGDRMNVCKNLFLSTLGIGEKTVYGWVEAANHGIPVKQPEQETQGARKRVQEERHGELRQNVRAFLESLPKLESHYCRSSSSKLYIEPVFESMHALYQEYKNYSETNKAASRKVFNEVFSGMNLSLFTSKKDQCDLCCGFEVGNIPLDTYEKHQERKSEARAEKDRDKACAMETNSVKVVTMDVQSVLLSLKLQASALYYKSKLACHNFTVYDLETKDVSCYFWYEGEGDLSGNSFATCITHYTETVVAKYQDVKHFMLYSDGCGYQNPNSVLANALCHLPAQLDIQITQKYLEKGHTQMEVDSVHSSIKRKIRKRNIYVPQNYVEAIGQCRPDHPYLIHYVDHKFFKNFSDLNNYNSIRPGTKVGDPVVSDLRVIAYTPDGNVQYKLSYSDEFMDLPRRARNSDPNTVPLVPPKQLHDESIKIKRSKYDHLHLALKAVLPADYRSFYDNLHHCYIFGQAHDVTDFV